MALVPVVQGRALETVEVLDRLALEELLERLQAARVPAQLQVAELLRLLVEQEQRRAKL